MSSRRDGGDVGGGACGGAGAWLKMDGGEGAVVRCDKLTDPRVGQVNPIDALDSVFTFSLQVQRSDMNSASFPELPESQESDLAS